MANSSNRLQTLKKLAQKLNQDYQATVPPGQKIYEHTFVENLGGKEVLFQKLGPFWYAFMEENGVPFFARIESSQTLS